MNKFIAKFSEQIEGALTGFDRLVFRGTLRAIEAVNKSKFEVMFWFFGVRLGHE